MPPPKGSVAGIAVNGDKLFIAKRVAGGDLGGKWEFPGGKIEAGESGEDAVRREYREEFGAQVEAGPLLATAEFTHNNSRYTLSAYQVFLNTDTLALKEHTEWQWAALGDIKKLDFAGSDRLLLDTLQAYLEQKSGVHD